MTRTKFLTLAMATLAVAALALDPARAADEHDHGHAEHEKHEPKYGGIVEEVGRLQYELVMKPDATRIYVEDHGKKVSVKGGKATVTLLEGTNPPRKLVLLPAGENVLEAKPGVAPSKGVRAVAVVLLRGKETTVRFGEKK